jgi:ferredoxin/flavodoxin
MKIGVFYFSGTGNTRHFAKKIAEGINQTGAYAEAIDIKNNPRVEGFDAVGICFPVYSWAAPWALQKWVRNLPDQKGKKAFVFATFAGKDTNAILRLIRLCQGVGLDVVNWGKSVAPESWTVVRTEEFLERWEKKSKKKTADDPIKFGKNTVKIFKGESEKRPLPKFKRSAFDLVIPFYKPSMLRLWYRVHLDKSKCTKCGLCAEVCPTASITLTPYPKFKRPCAGCYGCINLCPTEALESLLTKSKDRYTPNF